MHESCRRFGVLVVTLVPLLLHGGAARGDEVEPPPPASQEQTEQEDRSPRHRIDFGAEWFDAAEGTSVVGFLNYGFVPHPSHSLAATLPLVGADFAEVGGSGIGDLRLQWSYAPSVKLTASPWVPNSLGMGFGLIVPTGDIDKATGDDRWVVIPTIGWVVPFKKRFSFLPTLQFFETFGEGDTAEDGRFANLELGLIYVAPSEFWVNYTPSFFKDYRPVEGTSVDHTLTLGQQFTKVFALSLQLGTVDRPDEQDERFRRSSDRRAALTAHFVLPW